MAIITKHNIKFHSDFKLLPSGFSAITLFGNVFSVKSFEDLDRYLDTFRGRVMANHEHWHMLQAESFMPWKNSSKFFKNLSWFLGYVWFYILYIGYWIKNLFKFGFNKQAYYNIPFEKEAYDREHSFNDEYQHTRWKDYK